VIYLPSLNLKLTLIVQAMVEVKFVRKCKVLAEVKWPGRPNFSVDVQKMQNMAIFWNFRTSDSYYVYLMKIFT